VVSVFENRTGDSTLDKLGIMAADYTRIALARTDLLDVIGPSFDLWNPLNARRAHQASPQTIVRQTGATLIISGAYYRDGDTLVFAAVGTDAATQRVIFAFDSVRAGVRQWRESIEQVRQHVMSAIATRVDTALAPWAGNASTPPVRFDAYQAFADGMTSFIKGIQSPRGGPVFAAHYALALASLERAYRLDSTYFAPAIWWIFARTNIGDLIGADSVIRALAPRRASMSPYDGTLYDYAAAFAEGTPERRYQLDRTLVTFAPASEFRYCLARDALQAGHTREALAEIAALDDSYSWTRMLRDIPSFRIRAHAQLREFDKALSLAKEIQTTSPSDLSVIFPEIDVLSATGRLDEIARLVDQLSVAPGVRGASAANLMLYAGLRFSSANDPARARRLFARALAYYDSAASATDVPDGIIFGRARSLYYLERWDESRTMFVRLARQPLGSTRYDRRAMIFLGALAARRGDTSDVARLRTVLQRSVGTRAEKAYFDATVAALLGQKGQAIELLNSAISLGAQIWEVMAEGDAAPSMNPDFVGLRELPAYQRVVALW
jgi:tetratricopeptide (TPR) repeat protein